MKLANAPAQIVAAWANGVSTKTNPIPVPSQQGITPGAASWTDGFPPLCDIDSSDGGVPPKMADMNGGLYQMSAVDVWMSAGGGFPYNAAFQTAIGGYPKGARVLMASGNGYWISTADNNLTDPDTGGAGWASDDSNAITALTGDVTATGPGSAAATLAASGVTAGSYIGADITVDAKGRVTNASSGFTTGSNANGYWVKDPTGHIRQWGFISVPSGSSFPNGTFTFPTTFTNISSIVITGCGMSTINGSSLSTTGNIPVFAAIAESVTTGQWRVDTNVGNNFSAITIQWTADGF